jgi:hypothetical protein
MTAKNKPLRSPKTALTKDVEHAFPKNACVHIDKIHMTGPLTHKPRGTINYINDEKAGLTPSHTFRKKIKSESNNEDIEIHSRDMDEKGMAHKLEIHCCPPQVLQKHNIFGHSCVVDYVNAVFDQAILALGMNIDSDVDPDQLAEWRKGAVWITVIHLTCNFRCPEHLVLPIIDAIDQNNRCGKHRDFLTSISLGYTTEGRSQHHGLTVYSKPAQLDKKWRVKGTYQNKLLGYIVDSIRGEVKIFSMGLAARSLQYAMDWNDVDVAALFFEIFEKYSVKYAIQPLLTKRDVENLTKAETNAYLLWLGGRSMADQFESRSTTNKYINSIREHTGLNTSGHRRPEPLPEAHLADIFSAENALPIPDWLLDTPHYAAPNGKKAQRKTPFKVTV